MEKLDRLEANPLRSKWPLMFAGIALLCIISYALFMRGDEFYSRTIPGYVYGIVTAVAIAFLAFLRVRKSFYNFKFGSAHGWVQAHVYIGIMTAFFILLHTGFRLSGLYSAILFVLLALVIGSGVVGALIYMIIPASLTKFGREMLPKEEIDARLDKHAEDAEKAAAGSAGMTAVYEKIKPYFSDKRTRWWYLFKEEKELLREVAESFDEMKKGVPDADAYGLDILASIYADAARLHFKWAKLRILRAWLDVHVPITAMMLTASIFHIASVIYY